MGKSKKYYVCDSSSDSSSDDEIILARGPRGHKGVTGPTGPIGPTGPSTIGSGVGNTSYATLIDVTLSGLTGTTGTSGIIDIPYYNSSKWSNVPFQSLLPIGGIFLNGQPSTDVPLVTTQDDFIDINITGIALSRYSFLFEIADNYKLKYIGTKTIRSHVIMNLSGQMSEGVSTVAKLFFYISKNSNVILESASVAQFYLDTDNTYVNVTCQCIIDLETDDELSGIVINKTNSNDVGIATFSLIATGVIGGDYLPPVPLA